MARAYAGHVGTEELPSLLQELGGELQYLYTETSDARRWMRLPTAASTADVQRGRAFGPRCDVQFARSGDGFRITVLSDLPRAFATAHQSLDLGTLDAEETTYILWGVREAGATVWSERGMPGQWEYPVAGAPRRVGVRTTEYRDHDSGEVQFVRYRELTAIGGDE